MGDFWLLVIVPHLIFRVSKNGALILETLQV